MSTTDCEAQGASVNGWVTKLSWVLLGLILGGVIAEALWHRRDVLRWLLSVFLPMTE